MKIIRFIDTNGSTCFGHSPFNDQATLIEDNIFSSQYKNGPQVKIQKLLAPVTPPAILCIGLNYRHHAMELGLELPEHPVLFMKNPAAVNAPDNPIELPTCCMEPPEVDYEVELAVIIGKEAKNVPVAQALEYVLGYTIGNDISARTWQKKAGAGQWVKGKSFDTFCPLGPVMVTADEIPDPQNLNLTSYVNGELRQAGNTSDMIFSVAELISYLSTDTTLLPGTVIMTGTPSGVGCARKPPVFLQQGDILKMEINKIGTLTSPVSLAK